MATVTKSVRVANPARARRRMTAKQIKFFGTKRQKAAIRAARKRKARVTTKRHATRHAPRASRQQNNPAPLVLTLGAINPRPGGTRRKKTTARKGTHTMRKKAARRSRGKRTYRKISSRRRSNPHTMTVHRRGHHRRRNVYRRRRNALAVGGAHGARAMGTLILGGLVGVAAAKILPGFLPAGLSGMGGSPVVRVLVSVGAAYLAAWVARKVMPSLGDGVLIGGLMQSASVALNAFLPSVGSQIGLSGLGAFAPASFPVPQNPIVQGAAAQRLAIAAASAPKPGMGSTRAFSRAFGA